MPSTSLLGSSGPLQFHVPEKGMAGGLPLRVPLTRGDRPANESLTPYGFLVIGTPWSPSFSTTTVSPKYAATLLRVVAERRRTTYGTPPFTAFETTPLVVI